MMTNQSHSKQCFKCKKYKDLNDFYKHSGMSDGHLNKCKSCVKKDVSKNYRDNKNHYVKYEKLRCKTKKRKESALEYQRKRRSKHPEKSRAYLKVHRAIKDGSLKREPCEKCGDINTEAHHDDYLQPLNVTWLCFKCHRKHHGQNPT